MHRHAIRQLTNRACFLAAPSGRYVTANYANFDRVARTLKTARRQTFLDLK